MYADLSRKMNADLSKMDTPTLLVFETFCLKLCCVLEKKVKQVKNTQELEYYISLKKYCTLYLPFQLPYHPGHDDLVHYIINLAFKHFKYKEG